jgi:hypothetical protein
MPSESLRVVVADVGPAHTIWVHGGPQHDDGLGVVRALLSTPWAPARVPTPSRDGRSPGKSTASGCAGTNSDNSPHILPSSAPLDQVCASSAINSFICDGVRLLQESLTSISSVLYSVPVRAPLRSINRVYSRVANTHTHTHTHTHARAHTHTHTHTHTRTHAHTHVLRHSHRHHPISTEHFSSSNLLQSEPHH